MVRSENENLRKQSKEKTEECDKLTKEVRAAGRRAEGLLGVARYATLQAKGLSENERVEYAAQMMYFLHERGEEAERLTTLLKGSKTNRGGHDPRYGEFPPGAVEIKRDKQEDAGRIGEEKPTIPESTREHAERLRVARSNMIPGEAMNENITVLILFLKENMSLLHRRLVATGQLPSALFLVLLSCAQRNELARFRTSPNVTAMLC